MVPTYTNHMKPVLHGIHKDVIMKFASTWMKQKDIMLVKLVKRGKNPVLSLSYEHSKKITDDQSNRT